MKTAVCCVSTYNHLHYVLALARSIRRCWSEQPDILVLLLDHPDEARPGFEELKGSRFLSPEELPVPDLNWVRLKFNASELACACKPLLIGYALGNGYDLAWYVDSDILFFDDPLAMRNQSSAHDIVVTPHLFSPIPEKDAWTRPTMGHLAGAGVLNAGLFTARRGDAVFRFLADWSAMAMGPGACVPELGDHREQHAFNWAPALAQDVCVCRDKRINVAYWNLHERPLRWAHLDGGPKDRWLLDGEVMCCFHFSGFDWENGRLSRHDHRHRLGLNINLHALGAHYEACLDAAGRAHYRQADYGYAKAGTLVLYDDVRRHLKLLEAREKLSLDIRSEQSGTLLVDRILGALPGNHTLLPRMLEEVLIQRPDLQALDDGELLFPGIFLNWCLRYLQPAYGDRVPLFRSSLLAAHRGMLAELARRCADLLPGESEARISDDLVHGRPHLMKKLKERGRDADLLNRIETGSYLVIAANPVLALRTMMRNWPSEFRSVPPLGRGDVPLFRERVRAVLAERFLWPEAHRDFLERLDPEVSLARALSVIRRQPLLLTELRCQGLSRRLLEAMVPLVNGPIDFDAADLALVDWYIESVGACDAEPAWRHGVGRRLFSFARRTPRGCRVRHAWRHDVFRGLYRFVQKTPWAYRILHKTRERERLIGRLSDRFLGAGTPPPPPVEQGVGRGRRDLDTAFAGTLGSRLLPLLGENGNDRPWQCYLAWWAARNGLLDGKPAPAGQEATAALARLLDSADWKGLGEKIPSLAPEARGLNIFGYFKSPIGLGQMSRGVAAAQAANGDPYRTIVLTNMTMSRDFRLEDLYPDFAFHFPRNIAVTYPHIDYDLGDIFPAAFFRKRENIGYVAWEQRDMHPEWCRRLERYDRLFALSRFAADSVARATARPCETLPCVVELDAARAKAFRRRDFGLPDDAFIAGFMFDASSSVERKNPLGAARALRQAFRGRKDVMAVVKVTNGDRPHVRRAVEEIRTALADGGIPCRMITHVMPREEVEGLLAQFDLYLSLHRCEGFGYTIAEAMWLGVPVVATAYSGNMDFMNEANSYPVRCSETVIREADGPFQPGTVWADPDTGHAAALCDQVYGNREAARVKTARAEMDVKSTVSVGAVAARLRRLLAYPYDSQGARAHAGTTRMQKRSSERCGAL